MTSPFGLLPWFFAGFCFLINGATENTQKHSIAYQNKFLDGIVEVL
jgi:hypothetical protein